MKHVWLVAAAIVCLGTAGWSGLLAANPQERSVSGTTAAPFNSRDVLTKYCVGCHTAQVKTGGFSLTDLDPSAVADHPQTWERVVRKLRVGMMPPQGSPKPDDATRWAVVSSLETALDRAAAAHP